MKATVKPGKAKGTMNLPASKSIMQRVCAAALLHRSKTIITDPGSSEDDKAALNIIQQLGAIVNHTSENTIEIISNGVHPVSDMINCSESGLSARLFIPISALCDKEITITGSGSLLKRPMTEYTRLLPQLGVSVTDTEGCLPISVAGPLIPATITLDGSMSSQFLSGMLMAYAFTATAPVEILVDNLHSKPYTDLTLQVLQLFGKNVTHHQYRSFSVPPTREQGSEVSITIEGDWSAASNFIVANAMGADIAMNKQGENSLQADKKILTVITDTHDAFDFDATDSPDLFPILSVYAGYCNGESSITGLHRLLHKESNRVETIMHLLEQLGISYFIEEDTLVIHGGYPFKSCTIDACNDHRIVMAAAIAALNADGPVTILGAEAVNKSYPGFFDALSSLGVNCKLEA